MPSNPAQILGKCQRLAECDWMNLPLPEILKELGTTHSNLTILRKRQEYFDALNEISEAWKERLRKSPDYNDLAKQIKLGVGISVKRLVSIVSLKKSGNKDVISAARLLAQMDGRFLGRDAEETQERRTSEETNSIANELVQMLKRNTGDSVQ